MESFCLDSAVSFLLVHTLDTIYFLKRSRWLEKILFQGASRPGVGPQEAHARKEGLGVLLRRCLPEAPPGPLILDAALTVASQHVGRPAVNSIRVAVSI